MRKTVCCALALCLFACAPVPPALRSGETLGERLERTRSLTRSGNAGGKNILENSCLYKGDFSISASEPVRETCDINQAVGDFVGKYGPPARTSQAPGDKTVLEYDLLFKENAYRVRFFFGCAEGKTEAFAMVECVNEKNRFMPGGPRKGERPPRFGMAP